MGLDMYLEKRNYVKNWSHTNKKESFSVVVKRGGKIVKDIKQDRIKYVIEEVGYWRKANAIHKYFVDVVASGEFENGADLYVSEEDLKNLLDTCNKVLKASKLVKGKIQNGTTWKNGKSEPIMEDGEYIEDNTVAKELLPSEEGFFFGSTDYNTYYIQDLEDTVKMLKGILADVGTADYYYTANW